MVVPAERTVAWCVVVYLSGFRYDPSCVRVVVDLTQARTMLIPALEMIGKGYAMSEVRLMFAMPTGLVRTTHRKRHRIRRLPPECRIP